MYAEYKDQIARMIDYLAQDKERYAAAAAMQADAYHLLPLDKHPLLIGSNAPEEFNDYPRFNLKEIHYDSVKMLHSELRGALGAQAGGRESVPSVRSNMGCGIVPALFGAVQELYEDKMPWLLNHLPKEQLAEMTKDDLTITPEFKAALDHMEYMTDALKGSGITVYPLDIQGAFDTAHLLLGDAIFYEMYDDPEFVHHLLDLSTEAIDICYKECLKRISSSDKTVCHYNAIAIPRDLGGVKMSEDTSTLLSKEQIDEFVRPYLHRTLENAGGGYIHYCGKNDHLYKASLEEPMAFAINFGNPEKHDMEQVMRDCAAHGKLYLGWTGKSDDESFEEHFARMAKAAAHDGKMHLVVQTGAAPAELAARCKAWDDACEKALKN